MLVGAPGSGKTTVGQQLAEELGVDFRDTDADVAAAAGMGITDIFVLRGEDGFRALEVQAVLQALGEHDGVLALGGGAVTSVDVREALAGLPVVWLRVEAGTAVRRVGLSGPRPVLLGNVRAHWQELLTARAPLYEQVAQWQVATDERDPAAVAAEIAQRLRGEDG